MNTHTTTNIETENRVEKLPLWRQCLEDMLADGVDHGKLWDASYFEQKLKCKRDSMEFGLAISSIRRELEKHGYYLSGRGFDGNAFAIIPANENVDAMNRYSSNAVDLIKRAAILGTLTRRELLNEEERRRHDAVLERIQLRAALLARPRAAAKLLGNG